MSADTRQPIPPFREVFGRLFRLGVEALDLEQLRLVADGLPEPTRRGVAGFLGAEGVAALAGGIDEAKAQVLVQSYPVDDAT